VGRPKNGDVQRARIVDGLLATMSKRGYAGASIQAIGKAAGLSPGLVHYHFENKHAVLVALTETLIKTIEARYATRLADARDPRARLYAFIDAHAALGPDADPRAVAAWNVLGAEALRDADVRGLYRSALARALRETQRRVRDLLRIEGRGTQRAGHIAALVVSSIEGAYRIGAVEPDGLPRGYAAPMLRSMVDALVAAQPVRP